MNYMRVWYLLTIPTETFILAEKRLVTPSHRSGEGARIVRSSGVNDIGLHLIRARTQHIGVVQAQAVDLLRADTVQ